MCSSIDHVIKKNILEDEAPDPPLLPRSKLLSLYIYRNISIYMLDEWIPQMQLIIALNINQNGTKTIITE